MYIFFLFRFVWWKVSIKRMKLCNSHMHRGNFESLIFFNFHIKKCCCILNGGHGRAHWKKQQQRENEFMENLRKIVYIAVGSAEKHFTLSLSLKLLFDLRKKKRSFEN